MQQEENVTVERDDGSYVVKKTKKSSILAFVFCVLLAFVIWSYAEAEEKKNATDVPVETQSGVEMTDGEVAL